MTRYIITFALSLAASLAIAAPRTRTQMESEARQALQHSSLNMRKAPARIQELAVTPTYAIYGMKDAPGFAVIAADDVAPAVLGVSSQRYNADNQNFRWWLNAVSNVVAEAARMGQPLRVVTPDNYDVPTDVEPLMTTLWDQDEPYNNYCPSGSYMRCVTGCVATAVAQVLNYHKMPEHGIGSHTIYYPYQNTSGEAVTADFENHYYDWDNMLDVYSYGHYNAAQAHAVAELMRDCGVASEMRYGTSFEGGSGTYSQDAAEGLRLYFGITDAQCVERNNYSDADWMEMVYGELSQNGPLYYGGDDYTGGHAFVLHGYRADGKVYVNWGWSGDDDGYYDISLLNPASYQFKFNQDMIIGVASEPLDLLSETFQLSAPGTLPQLLADTDPTLVGSLKVIGKINSADLDLLRQMAGCDRQGQRTKGHLSALDLSEATFVSGGGTFLTRDGQSFATTDGDLPPCAFYGCRRLQRLVLPQSGIRHFGDGALALCSGLKEVTVTPAADADFLIDDQVVWTADQTQVIAVLPTRSGTLDIPKGTAQLHDYALAGCAKVSKVILPATVTSLGAECFNGCSALTELRTKHRAVPLLGGYDVFKGVNVASCKLYVLSDMRHTFENAAQWNVFAQNNNIVEYGTTVKVRNAVRNYGDANPALNYVIVGDMVEGTPELSCEADATSPVGKYTITITPGTIQADESVEFLDGYLIIRKIPLTVSVADASRHPRQADPEFVVTYSGFVNGDDASCITVPPTVTTTATADSPAGTYQYVVSGGQALNYTFRYDGLGIFTILSEATGLDTLTAGQPSDVYNLQGTLVRSRATTLSGLNPGIYIVNGRKVVVK